MVEANKFPPNAVKVVTERGVVHPMGIVTKAQDAVGDIAATTEGARVVKVVTARDRAAEHADQPARDGERLPPLRRREGGQPPPTRSRIAALPRRW